VLYAYAISESAQPPAVGGLKGTTLRAVGDARQGVCAIVSEHRQPPVAADPEDLWAHEAVVEAAMRDGAVLPMRVGSAFADEAELVGALRARQSEFRRALERVDAAVELGVRAALAPEQPGADPPSPGPDARTVAGPGTAYMLTRLERSRSGRRLALAIHEPLAALARAATWQLSSSEPPQLIAAYLVDRERVETFRARVGDLEQQRGTAIVCTGPWPPYSFVSEEDR
jgi:hypothetical protein